MSGIDAVVVCVFGWINRDKIRKFFFAPEINRRCALELVGLTVVAIALLSLYFSLFHRAGMPILQASGIFVKFGWPKWSMFVLICCMPAIFEELAFRGVIQTSLESVLSTREALFIQAALFSLLHLMPMMFPSHLFMGLVLGTMRTRSKSLYPGMLFHASWNALVLIEELYLTS